MKTGGRESTYLNIAGRGKTGVGRKRGDGVRGRIDQIHRLKSFTKQSDSIVTLAFTRRRRREERNHGRAEDEEQQMPKKSIGKGSGTAKI
jgi:hypothetical protein